MTQLQQELPMAAHDSSLTDAVAAVWRMSRFGDCAPALRLARSTLLRARAAGDGATEAACLVQIAWVCLQLGHPDDGLDCLFVGSRLRERFPDAERDALAAALFPWLLVELGLADEGYAHADAAVAAAEALGDPQALAFALNCKAITFMYVRQNELALPLLERAVELAGPDVRPDRLALYLTNIAYTLVSQAEAAELDGHAEAGRELRLRALAFNDRAIAAATGCGDRWSLRTALCNGAEYQLLLGNPDAAEAHLRQWQGLPGEIGPREQIHYLYTRGELFTRAGATEDALATCKEAVALAEHGTHADHLVCTLRRLADAFEAAEDHRSALAAYKRHFEAVQRQMGQVIRRRAQLAEMQFENEKLRAHAAALEQQARHDPLTGLGNRRHFNEHFAGLRGRRFVLGILDLDRFKAINDAHSHLVGDRVLQLVGAVLGQPGIAMTAFRLGGEEFALVFEEPGAALATAEAMRVQIASVEWGQLSPGLRVTASIGLASTDEAGSEGVMAAADRRLYAAKAAGRNRVVSMPSEPSGMVRRA